MKHLIQMTYSPLFPTFWVKGIGCIITGGVYILVLLLLFTDWQKLCMNDFHESVLAFIKGQPGFR